MKTTMRFSRVLAIAVCLGMLLSLAPFQAANVQAVSTTVVISQVYGGGGNSGATLKNDFIELFNLGSTTVDLTGWTVQYASTAGTTWQKTALTGSIEPGRYYLVQEAAGTGGTVDLPTPDAIGTIAMSGTNAKVALVDNSTTLTGSCPTGLVDFVGYGSTTNCSENTPTANLSNTTAALRKDDGSTDTDNNSADFTIGTPTPRNSSFPFMAVGQATPNAVITAQKVLLTVAVSPGTNPASTGITVSCNLVDIGGAETQFFFDDGSNGDVTAGDNTFSYAMNIFVETITGPKILACEYSDAETRSGSTTIVLTVIEISKIGDVQGAVGDTADGTTIRSPFAPASGNSSGNPVAVQGVIYETTLQAVSNSTSTYKGFFIQNTSATGDTDPNTSDGLFVFMNTSSSLDGPDGTYTPTIGDEVVITGRVSEYYYMTELTNPVLAKPVIRSVDIAAEVPPVVANPPANLAEANRYWERLESMRVQVPQNSIVLGGRNVFNPADAEVWVARPDSTIAERTSDYARRAFRDAHPLDDNYDADNWDGNGYRILMGSLGIKSAVGNAQALIDPAVTFDTLTNAPSGGLNYTFNKYRIEISGRPTFSEGPDPAANNPPQVFDTSIHYSVVDYNLENLYDFRDNPFSGCDFSGNVGCSTTGTPFTSAVNPPYDYVPASESAYQARLSDIATQIINDLHSPDILMVQEVENQDVCTVTNGALACGITDNVDGKPDVLQELALKIVSLGGPAYESAFDRDSSDLRGILPAFMYLKGRVELLPPVDDPVLGALPAIGNYTEVEYDSDVSNPKSLNAVYTGTGACETSWVFPRAPSVALFRIFSATIDVGSQRDVYVVNNHFKSGPDTCVDHRTEQAKYNAALVAFIQAAKPDARIVVGGDLNVYPKPDNTASGAAEQLASLYDPGLGLKNLWEVLLGEAPEAAYSYVYLGQAQTLDQMFVNQALLADLVQFRIAHINSDFPADYSGDLARGTSDHDPNVANFVINDAPVVDAGGPYEVPSNRLVLLSASGTDPEAGPLTYAWDLDNNGSYETAGQNVEFSGSGLTIGSIYTVKVRVTDNGGLSVTDTAEVTVIEGIPVSIYLSLIFHQ